MIRALLLCVLGVTLVAGGAGYQWGWGYAALVTGLALIACGLLLDVDKADQEAP